MDIASRQPDLSLPALDAVLTHGPAYDLIDAAVGVSDRDGALLYRNAAFERLNAALRDAPDRLYHHGALLESPELRAELERACTGREPRLVRRTLYYAPRAPVDLTLRLQPLTRGDAVVAVLITVAEESVEYDRRHVARLQHRVQRLGERVHALTQEKNRHERMVRLLLRETPFAAMLLNGRRQIMQINRAAEHLLGLPSHLAAGRACDDILRRRHGSAGCDLRPDRPIHLEESTVVTAEGEVVPVLRSAVMLTDNDEPVILETFVDIRERKRTEDEIRRLNEAHQLILDSTGEGILGTDTDLRCTFANRAAAGMLGYTPEELTGRDIHDFLHHSDDTGTPITREDSPVARTLREKKSHQADDAALRHKEGIAVPVEYHCSPILEGPRVTGTVLVCRDVTETRAMARQVDFMTTHDPLTGLANRREFERRLASATDAATRGARPHVLCYLDLDQFKIVNDTCSHTAGDALLRQLTGVLKDLVPARDTLARLGGDEFGVIFSDCDLDQAYELAERLRAAIEEFRFVWQNEVFTIASSMGLVALGSDTPDVGAALSIADSACHIAKERGRNRIQMYRSDDEELVRRHGEMQWISRINTALEDDRFCLYGQPIVALGDPDPSLHIEILLRMRDEDGSLILPGAFIDAAERYNLMRAIDVWVVEHTFRWLAAYNASHETPILCSINLSGQSVSDARFHQVVLEKMDRLGISPAQLCFEITETAAIANLAEAERLIARLRARGCHFALDDFGSGMSSFRYLKNLPVDAVKIDGEFVRDIVTDPVDRAMVEAIHQIAHVLGLKTIAEFVEDDAILTRLRAIGVDFAQGFGVARPAPLDSFA